MSSATILVVDDERLIRWSIRKTLERQGYSILEAETVAEALKLVESADLALLDFKLPDGDGLQLLQEIKAKYPDVVVLMLTAHTSVDTAVAAMKQGAYHYASKPINLEEFPLLVEKALETTRLRRELKAIRASQTGAYSFDRIVGESPAMQQAKTLLRKIAASPAATVLLTGESGTGKDLAAKAVHHNSSRAQAPFMNITCSAMPESLFESELFGHERGAFTDAKQQRKGLLEQAHTGTVFLDEIGEMPLTMQAKLLRFLEDKAFKRVGGNMDLKVDVRVIAATNRNLDEAVQKKEFREDLFYRLNVVPVRLPPLRERNGDIALLAKFFVQMFSQEMRKSITDITPAALARLAAHKWPGNIRELRNVVERAVLLAERTVLDEDDFPMVPAQRPGTNSAAASVSTVSTVSGASPTAVSVATAGAVSRDFVLPLEGVSLEQVERSFVVQALARAGGNQTRAAALLGISRDQFRYRMEKFGLLPNNKSE